VCKQSSQRGILFRSKKLKILIGSVFLAAASIAAAQQAVNANAPLMSIGPNQTTCGMPTNGPFVPKGVVTVHYNAVQQRFKINVSVHDASPNATYVVDIRCWTFGPQNAVGALITDNTGTGSAEIDLSLVPQGTFYIDIAIPPGAINSGTGAGGYGDTYVAGPFNLQVPQAGQ